MRVALRYLTQTNATSVRKAVLLARPHTRVLPDGTVVRGAQFDFPVMRAVAAGLRLLRFTPEREQSLRGREWIFAGAPWITPREEFDKAITADEMAKRFGAMQAGVLERQGTSSSHPPHV